MCIFVVLGGRPTSKKIKANLMHILEYFINERLQFLNFLYLHLQVFSFVIIGY